MKVYFTETQRFRQWWLIVILVVVNLIAISALYFSLQEPIANDQLTTAEIILVIGAGPLLSIILILIPKLETRIQEDGIYIKFFPFHWSYKIYKWSDISKAYVRQYNPLGEYGGWGIRFGFGNGKAYNVSGNTGLQLELHNGKKVLIGTNRPDELEKVLSNKEASQWCEA